ncbi:MAG TPA: sulfite exporter TauE/SafE family protein [Spirochaetota bacterium]|nr:sulfite exporter TauE/SafE family protein [Spirochaetota bacterium]HOL57177.1 sulfite exporter TauE/SafE family protein [Spirochaetota bacterium]
MKNINVYIKGIHCEACIRLIKEEFSKLYFIKDININPFTRIATITYTSEELDIPFLNNLIKKYGYEIVKEKLRSNILKNWILPIIITLFIVGVFFILQKSGLLEKIKLNQETVSYGFSFFTGILASVSSCFTVVGSIVIAFSEIYKFENKNGILNVIIPNILFQISRLFTFFILGGFLASIGVKISINGFTFGLINIFIAIIMILLGLNILGLIPSISNFGIKNLGFITKSIEKIKKSNKFYAPLALGFLTFFLPCGFTQSMQIFAIGSGSFIKGALYLFLFALGTFPVLFITGITASFSQLNKLILLKRTGAFLVVIFGIYTFFSGISIIYFKGNLFSYEKENYQSKNNNLDNQKEKEDQKFEEKKSQEIQTVKMSIKYYGFEPQVLKIKKGIKVRWEIYGEEVTGCTNAIIFPYTKQRIPIRNNQKVILEFMPPDKRGYLPFSCWMGMVRGVFIVE